MSQKSQNKPKRKQSTTVSSSYFTPLPRDVYSTPKDTIWGDVVRHERLLEKTWNKIWQHTIVPRESRPDKTDTKDSRKKISQSVTPFYSLEFSPGIPTTASASVGWRSSDQENTMELFRVKYLPEKKRFVQEQYGHYRFLKYLQSQTEISEEKINVPQKHIRHSVKPLLC